MTIDQQNHIDTIIARFSSLARAKYEAGQREHGGNLWMKPGVIDMAINEAIDQVIYLVTIKQQLEDPSLVNPHLRDKDHNGDS